MRRREFLAAFGGTVIAWPLVARAQQAAMPTIGYLYTGTPESNAHLLAAFRQGLNETGHVEGRNVAVEYRWARNDADQLPELAADLVRSRVAVIVTPGSISASLAAKAATVTIPIVFSMGGDPVREGLVTSFNRPGVNITGITSLNTELAAKRIGLLHELAPTAVRFAVLAIRDNPAQNAFAADAKAAASALGLQVEIFTVSTDRDIDDAFGSFGQKRIEALALPAGPLFGTNRVHLLNLATRYAVPTIYSTREAVIAGGLMSYGPNVLDEFRQVGIYTGRILKGEKPGDLPVVQSNKFELVINLKTAKMLGLTVPLIVQMTADEVIE